jgi:hypothetical protein
MNKETDSTQRTLISPQGHTANFPTDLPPIDDYLGPAKTEVVKFRCGHTAPMFYAFSVNGLILGVTQRFITEKEECADCMTKRIAKFPRCAVCGRRINEGSAVALYLDDGQFRLDATKVKYHNKSCVVGCAECAPYGDFLAGEWQSGHFFSMEALIAESLIMLLR